MLIGICGKSGSGKTTLANEFIKMYGENAIHCEIDKIGHKVLVIDEVKQELINCFGEQIISGNNIDRKKLGEIVFDSRNEMNKLSDITWKYMQIEIDKIINDNKNKLIILDWILLPISKYFKECSTKILLDIPYETRKERAKLRDNISDADFALREKASIEFDKDIFNFVIKDDVNKEFERLVALL